MENTVIVELKAVDTRARIHKTQVITYLKLTNLPVGLLMNLNVERLTDGIRRVVRPDLYVRTSLADQRVPREDRHDENQSA